MALFFLRNKFLRNLILLSLIFDQYIFTFFSTSELYKIRSIYRIVKVKHLLTHTHTLT